MSQDGRSEIACGWPGQLVAAEAVMKCRRRRRGGMGEAVVIIIREGRQHDRKGEESWFSNVGAIYVSIAAFRVRGNPFHCYSRFSCCCRSCRFGVRFRD